MNAFWSWETKSEIEKKAMDLMKVLSATVFTLVFTYPVETAKVRYCLEFYKKKRFDNYQSTVDAMGSIAKQNGMFGLVM